MVPGRESLASYEHPQVRGPRGPGAAVGRKHRRWVNISLSLQAALQAVSASVPEHSKPLEKAEVLFGQERDPRFGEIYSGISPGGWGGGERPLFCRLPSMGQFPNYACIKHPLWGLPLSLADQTKPISANSVPTSQPLFAPGNSFGASRPAESFR